MFQGENLETKTGEALGLLHLETVLSVERIEAHEIARRVVAKAAV